jgi:hypothetical protein
MRKLAADPDVMGEHASGRGGRLLTGATLVLVIGSVAALAWLTATG